MDSASREIGDTGLTDADLRLNHIAWLLTRRNKGPLLLDRAHRRLNEEKHHLCIHSMLSCVLLQKNLMCAWGVGSLENNELLEVQKSAQ